MSGHSKWATSKRQKAQEITQRQLPGPSGEEIDEPEFDEEHGALKRETRNEYNRIIALDDSEFGKY